MKSISHATINDIRMKLDLVNIKSNLNERIALRPYTIIMVNDGTRRQLLSIPHIR